MRGAFLLLLLLVACRNNTEERLKKIEKDVSQIKANQPVETVDMETATATTATDTASLPIEKRYNALHPNVASVFVHQRMAVYVPLASSPTAGLVYQIERGKTVLYRYEQTSKLYRAVEEVGDIERDATLNVVPDYLARMHHILDPYPLDKTYANLDDEASRRFIEKGKAAFIPTKDDPEGGLVNLVVRGANTETVLYKFDPHGALYRPVEVVASLADPNGHLALDDTRRTELTEVLVKY